MSSNIVWCPQADPWEFSCPPTVINMVAILHFTESLRIFHRPHILSNLLQICQRWSSHQASQEVSEGFLILKAVFPSSANKFGSKATLLLLWMKFSILKLYADTVKALKIHSSACLSQMINNFTWMASWLILLNMSLTLWHLALREYPWHIQYRLFLVIFRLYVVLLPRTLQNSSSFIYLPIPSGLQLLLSKCCLTFASLLSLAGLLAF